ncbi:unnamed protein product [Plutella xylostella]|uniref:PAT complex subunit CCDC47 n=1 Tax=Plutella xylostella TaxID=51655 RepID=A0A8S4FTX4_PLUXY|nr:unnamed protein product [Plutella xylostella]
MLIAKSIEFGLLSETGSDVVSLPGEEAGWRREAEHCFTIEEAGWRREAEHCFTMWCSGRSCCEGMLLTLKLIKRQDLLNVLINVARPKADTLQMKVQLGKDDGDPFVLCIAQKKTATRLAKEMHDLSVFCPERRPGDKHGLPASLSVMSESGEATAGMLDARATQCITLYHRKINYIHISDRYTRVAPEEQQAATTPPETEKVLVMSINIDGENDEDARPLLMLLFHMLDKLKRMRLSKEVRKCSLVKMAAMLHL